MTEQFTAQGAEQPRVVRINMLDTDYAKMIGGEPIAKERRERLEATNLPL